MNIIKLPIRLTKNFKKSEPPRFLDKTAIILPDRGEVRYNGKMAEMNTSTGPGERWGMETPVPTIEAGPSAIGEVALRTREGIADVDGVLAHGDIHRPDLRAYLSSPTPVEAGIMSVGTELVEELGDILPGRTENPGFIPEKLKAHRPGIGEESAWPGFDN